MFLKGKEKDKMMEEEVVFMCILLVIVGYEIMVNFISNLIFCLLQYLEQFLELKENLDFIVIVVEECLCFESFM